MDYAVIFTYSFDDECSVFLFNTFDEAMTFIKDSYQEELRIDIEENGWDSYGTINEESGIAEIFTRFADHEDTTTMRIGFVHCKSKKLN